METELSNSTRTYSKFDSLMLETKALFPAEEGEESATDRQVLVPGFDQKRYSARKLLLIGAGGLGSLVALGAVRKGIRALEILDPQVVELSNLGRQLFFEKDLYQPKATALVRNLEPHATCQTHLTGHELSLQGAIAVGLQVTADLAIVGVDNGETRAVASQYFRRQGIPVCFIAVDLVAEHGYAFIQEPGKACFGCAFPRTHGAQLRRCNVPAVIDINMVVAGMALFAIDSILMDRKRGWNYRTIHLSGFAADELRTVEQNPNCPLCGLDEEREKGHGAR